MGEPPLDYPDMICPHCDADTAHTHRKGCPRNPVTVGDLIDLLSKFDRARPLLIDSQNYFLVPTLDAREEWTCDDVQVVRLECDDGDR